MEDDRRRRFELLALPHLDAAYNLARWLAGNAADAEDVLQDAYLRAFDARSGEELWQGRLPVPGVANPMTYLWKGEQYVAIAAGGHSEAGTSIGDSVVAFRLARAGESPSLWSRTIDRPGGRFASGAIAAIVVLALIVIALWRWRRRRKRRAASI